MDNQTHERVIDLDAITQNMPKEMDEDTLAAVITGIIMVYSRTPDQAKNLMLRVVLELPTALQQVFEGPDGGCTCPDCVGQRLN